MKATRPLVEVNLLKPFDTCQLCGLDPNLKKNEGRQIYVCDRCKALVCSDCSENEPNNEIFCLPCDYEIQLGD